MERQLEAYQKIERSIIKKFRKQLWTPFIVAVKRYELIQAGDKIAVCISGGKDSMVMAKLLQELQRHSEVPFELVFLVMDPGYNEINRQKIESNAALLHIPITVFETNIFDVALLPLCPDAPRSSLQKSTAAWLQQNRARPSFQ